MIQKPDFSKIQFEIPKTGTVKNGSVWQTNEGIPVKTIHSKAEIKDASHLIFGAGVPPFLRGPYATMYIMRPWTIRQYAGFSTAKDSNAFYKRNLAALILATSIK